MNSYLRRKRVPTRDTNLGPPSRRWRFIPALAVGVTLLVGGVLPATSFAADLTGFVFIDMDSTNGAYDNSEIKVGSYSLEIKVGDSAEQSIKAGTDGHFTFEFDDTGTPTISITNMNFPRWKQTTHTGTNTNGMTGRYTFQIDSPYPEVEIGIAEGGSVVASDEPEIPEILISEVPIPSNDNTLPIIIECTEQSFQVTFLCSLPSGTTGYEIESCSWNFGDNTFGNGIDNGLPVPFRKIMASHSYENAGTYSVDLSAIITNTNTNTSHYQSATYSLIAGNGSGGDAFDCLCSSDRAMYRSDGDQIITNPSPTGGTTKVVYISDSVGVDKLDNVPLTEYGICIDTGGELIEASSNENLKLPNSETSFVYNRGTIRISGEPQHYVNGTGTAMSGGNVILKAVKFIINDNNGRIKAGIGGNDIVHSDSSNGAVEGKDGGDISLDAQVVTNRGYIGTEQAISYNSGNLVTDGGNGGVGSRSYYVRRTQEISSATDCQNWLLGQWQTDSQYNLLPYSGTSNGSARGGNGGSITLKGMEIENWGTVKSGHGGDGRAYECGSSNRAYPGEPGDVIITPTATFRGNGTLDGSGGRILLEPVIITLGSNFKIKNTSEVRIFGGEGAKIILDDLSADAISSDGDIILAVGEGGSIDLRSTTTQVFNSTSGTVKIYADEVLLDEGTTIEELANVVVDPQPAKILYAVTLTGTGVVKGDENATTPITVQVQNSGPTTDTYTLSLENLKGWQVSGLPNTVTVDGLKSEELTLQVILSENPGEANDITVTATSQTDATAIASMKTQVIVKGELVVEPEKVALTITQSTDGTVSAEGIDCGENCTEDYEVNSEVTLTATPNDGYNFNDWQGDCAGTTAELTVTLDEAKSCTATFAVIEIPNELPTAALAITPETGVAPLTIALDGSASSDTDGTIASHAWTASDGQTANGQNAELTFSEAGDYTITLEVTDNNDATNSATKNVKVNVKVEAAANYVASGTIRDKAGNPVAGVTVQIGDKTVITNEAGYWESPGLPEGDDYIATASKDGYTFAPIEFALGNEVFTHEVVMKPLSALNVKVDAEPTAPKQGENITFIATVTNGGSETATGVALSNVLSSGSLVSIEALDGGECDADTVICTLPDLTTGATAKVKLVVSNSAANKVANEATVTANEYPADVHKKSVNITPHLSVSASCTPQTVMPEGGLHCTAEVVLSSLAPNAATGVELVMTLPNGVELQSLNTDYGMCDSSKLPILTCSLTDLSVDSPDDISSVAVNFEEVLQDPGLLALTHDVKVTANGYSAHTSRARTKVFIPPEYQVDFAIVIDVTGSMEKEMDGTKSAVNNFIKGLKAQNQDSPLTALVVFRDEVMVKAVTTDLSLVENAISKMEASGGGTCPEASVEALDVAITHVKEGGTIFFVTDASPYEDADIAGIMERMGTKGIIFNAIITGDCTNKDSWNVQP